MATNFSNLRAVLTAATPIGLIAQLMIGAPSSFAQTSTAVFKPESQKIQLGNLRQLSLRLRSGQPVASSELDSYKEFCAEQASQANVRDTAQGKSDTRRNSRSQHFDNSNNWDKSHNKDSTYKQSGKVNVGLSAEVAGLIPTSAEMTTAPIKVHRLISVKQVKAAVLLLKTTGLATPISVVNQPKIVLPCWNISPPRFNPALN